MTTPAPRTKYAVCFPIGRYDESAAAGAHDPLGLPSWKAEDSGKPLPKALAKMTRGMLPKMKELVKAPPKWVPAPADGRELSLEPQIFPSLEEATGFLDSVTAIVEAPPDVRAASGQATGVLTRSSRGWMPPVPVVHAADYPGPKCVGTFRDFLPVNALPDTIRDLTVRGGIDRLLRGIEITPAGTVNFEITHTGIIDDLWANFTCYLDDDWRFDEIKRNARNRSGHGGRDDQAGAAIGEIILRAVYDIEKAFERIHPDAPAEKVADFWRSWQVQQHLALFCADIADHEIQPTDGRNHREAKELARVYINRRLAVFANELLAEAGGSKSGSAGAPKKRGRPPFSEEKKEAALKVKAAGGTNRDQAKVLYGTLYPTPQQVKSTSTIRREWLKKSDKAGRP